MFVRPPAVRNTRNPGRRQLPPRLPPGGINRPLLRQFVRTRRSDTRYEAYMLEVREGPAVNGNTNAAVGKSIPQPWVTVRDSGRERQPIGLPVSVCDALLKHLLTCVVPDIANHVESLEDGEVVSGSHNVVPDSQMVSPTIASADAKLSGRETNSEEDSPHKRNMSRVQHKQFKLDRLKPIRIVCEATGCIVEVTGKDPAAKRPSESAEESDHVVQVDQSRRWIVSAPFESRTTNTDDQNTESNKSTNSRRKHPWESRGALELYETLMGQFSTFLADVVTRYRSVSQLPEVRSLYSASGGRRFFFDLRDTRWGKRLHISQVTEMHRNVIGIPLEALVSFRTRLDMIIRSLGLEDQHVLKSEISGKPLESGQTQIKYSSRERSNEAVDSTDFRRNISASNVRGDQPLGIQQRGRDRRRPRIRNYGGNGARPAATQSSGGHSGDRIDHPTGHNTRSATEGSNEAVGSNHWNEGVPRNRRFTRRNPRQFNRARRPPQSDSGFADDQNLKPDGIQSTVQPVINANHMVPVAEASA